LALAQRNAIIALVSFACNNKDLSVAIKSHPNIYGAGGYPGMKYSSAFIDQIDELSASMVNLKVYGRDACVNVFDLVDNAGLVIGLHSSLMQYAWFKGKYVVAHPKTAQKAFASEIIDFNETSLFVGRLTHLLSHEADLAYPGKITYDLLLYMAVKQYAFDISFGNDVSIADDHFSPKSDISELRKASHLANSDDYGDIRLLVQSIIHSSDVNVDLLNERLC